MQVAGQSIAGHDFHALESIGAGWDEDPVTIVQVEDGRSGHGYVLLGAAAMESSRGEHTNAHQAVRIGDLDAYLSSTQRGVELGVNLAGHLDGGVVAVFAAARYRVPDRQLRPHRVHRNRNVDRFPTWRRVGTVNQSCASDTPP